MLWNEEEERPYELIRFPGGRILCTVEEEEAGATLRKVLRDEGIIYGRTKYVCSKL